MMKKYMLRILKCVGGLAVGLGLSLFAVQGVMAMGVEEESSIEETEPEEPEEPVIPSNVDENGYHYVYNEAKGAYLFVRYDGESATVDIPAAIGEIPVYISNFDQYESYVGRFSSNVVDLTIRCNIATGYTSFSLNFDGLKSVTFYSKISTKIYYPIGIENIQILGGCTEFPSLAYRTSLKTVKITSCDTKKTSSTFVNGCSALTSITLPSGLEEIGDYTFYCCSALKSVKIPTTVKKISEEAFSRSGITTISIPSSVKTIGANAFYNCNALATISLASGLEEIGESAFSGCSALKSVTLPTTVKKISKNAFASSGITAVSIPSSVKTIGANAFYNCKALKSLTIPSSVTSLDIYSVYGLPALTTLTINCKIGANSLNLGQNPKLTTVIFAGYVETMPSLPTTVTTLKMTGGCKQFPYLAYNTKIKTVQITKCTSTTIPEYTFCGCESLSSVTLPSTTKKISNYAFYGTTALKSITLPSSLTTIGSNCFRDAKSLKTVTFAGSALTKLGQSAFSDCTALTKISIPSSLKTLEAWTFDNCTSLYQVVLSKNTTTIYQTAFGSSPNPRLTIVAPAGSAAANTANAIGVLTTTTTSLKVAKGVPKTFVGGKLQLTVYNSPYKISFASSNKKIATVSSAGVITAKKAGTVTITATVNGKKYSYKYTVVARTQSNVLSIIYAYYVTASMTDYEKIVAADKWIVANTQYDYDNYLKHTIPWVSHSAKGVFEKGVAVCDGYAYAFQTIMQHYGISCNVVIGTANGGGHAWNEVKLGSYWYQVDVCWDDPIINGKATNTISRQTYLLITAKQMAKDHKWNQSSYHSATSTTYNKQINHTGYKGAVISAMNPSVTAGKTYTLKVSGTKEKVTFSTADKTIAKVNSKGVITGVKKGTTTISVKIGSKTFSVKVTVK